MRESYILNDDEILEIKGDRIFHDMWNEKEMDTIEWTVMQILGCSYDDIHGKVTVGNIRLVNTSLDDKEKYVDLVVNYGDTITVIELNNNASDNYLRNVLYSLNCIINSYIVGGKYTDKKVRGILVNLNWFNREDTLKYKDKEEIIYQYPMLNNSEEYLLKIININLDYFSKLCYDETEKKDFLWKLLTINKKKELEKLVSNNKMLVNYRNKINRLSKDKEYCRMVWDERIEKNLRAQQEYFDGKQEGIKEGLEQGLEKGLHEKTKEMVVNMHNGNLDDETIAKYANISVKEVKKIIEENMNN